MSARLSSRYSSRSPRRLNLLGRMLDPIDWLSEAIYSVLIILTFTLAYRIIIFQGNPLQTDSATYAVDLLFAALGAALAWGLIDGVMYVLLEVLQRSERHRLLQQLQAAGSEQEGVELLADELDYIFEPISSEEERRLLYRKAFAHLRRGEARPIGFTRADFTGALATVLVAVVAVLPSLAPLFLLRADFDLAIRVSNIVSFGVLFVAGYQWGRYTGAKPWQTGLLLVAVGAIMVAIAIPLGG